MVFLVVSVICGKYLLDYWRDSYDNRQNYRQVEEMAFPEKDTEDDDTESNADNPTTETDDFDYQALLDGREIIMGISVLKPEWIISFKAKAWLDLRGKTDMDSSNAKKHRNDIIRIASEIVLKKCSLPEELKKDMELFLELFEVSEAELKNLKIRGVKPDDIKETLKSIYGE